MDNFVKKYIYKNWIPIKKNFNKIILYVVKKLLD
jgi:hypothetical protein